MSKKILFVLLAAALILAIGEFAYARMHEGAAHATAENAGNKICPVSGEKIDDNMKATYEYEGKIYNFCCAGCIEEFKKDPEKYIKKVEEELRSAPEEKPGHAGHGMMPASGQKMHEGHDH